MSTYEIIKTELHQCVKILRRLCVVDVPPENEDLVYLQQQARALDDQFKVAARLAHRDLLESARVAVVSDDPEAYKVYRKEKYPDGSGIVRLANAEHLERLPKSCRVEFLHHHCSGELIRDVSIKAVHQHRETSSVLWQYSGSQ